MLTRERIEARLRRIAGNCELLGRRTSTSPADKAWCAFTIATIEALLSDRTPHVGTDVGVTADLPNEVNA